MADKLDHLRPVNALDKLAFLIPRRNMAKRQNNSLVGPNMGRSHKGPANAQQTQKDGSHGASNLPPERSLGQP
eukprot:3425163-Pyramimonas_sp.AAC.2